MTDDSMLVLRSDADGVATLTLNRPDKRNALNVAMFAALDAHLGDLEGETDRIGFFQAATITRLANLPQPVIAAVHGPCFTGGLELVLAADIILATQSSRFADTHGKWALVPGWGMTQRLPRRVGQHKAREMMFTAREYDGRQAEAMGLVNLCVADDMFEAELERLTRDIMALSWHSHRGNKALLNASDGMTLEAGLAHEIVASPGVGPDFANRVGATFGKR